MLSRTELQDISTTLTHGNIGHAEKLYFQDIILATVSRETSDQLVFKGGTALMKFYQLDRFSEDLDFTAADEIAFSSIVKKSIRDLENYGATVAEWTDEETEPTYHARLGIQGPLYTETRRSLCFLRLEINKQRSVTHVRTPRYTPRFPDIPSFDLAVLDETEILAEKIRALLTRHQPRDLYDIYHLLEKSVVINPELVQSKLEYYDLTYDSERVIESATVLESTWDTLEPLVYADLPPFNDALNRLTQEISP